ncbi:hypothetical protein QFC24_002351 [Naganishia onofrii]|uniref:Uncharacterized protein n=1 Tax=Naganishia onofrii TaxID=1851511 RepID=A0ACC2XRJ0_9TREE|nr:hypothetical protein QFC24_002351 [Naganishia onofrii]
MPAYLNNLVGSLLVGSLASAGPIHSFTDSSQFSASSALDSLAAPSATVSASVWDVISRRFSGMSGSSHAVSVHPAESAAPFRQESTNDGKLSELTVDMPYDLEDTQGDQGDKKETGSYVAGPTDQMLALDKGGVPRVCSHCRKTFVVSDSEGGAQIALPDSQDEQGNRNTGDVSGEKSRLEKRTRKHRAKSDGDGGTSEGKDPWLGLEVVLGAGAVWLCGLCMYLCSQREDEEPARNTAKVDDSGNKHT